MIYPKKIKMLRNLVIILGYLVLIFHPVLSFAASEEYQFDVNRLTSTSPGTTLFSDNTNRKTPKI